MGQTLRITFHNMDHTYQILNTGPISKETEELQIQLDGATHTLVRRDKNWEPKEDGDSPEHGLVAAIAKAISSRYRIFHSHCLLIQIFARLLYRITLCYGTIRLG